MKAIRSLSPIDKWACERWAAMRFDNEVSGTTTIGLFYVDSLVAVDPENQEFIWFDTVSTLCHYCVDTLLLSLSGSSVHTA